MHKVDLVDPGAFRKLTGAIASLGNVRKILSRKLLADRTGKCRKLGRDRVGEFRQVDHGKGRFLTGAASAALGYEIIHDCLTDLQCWHGGVLAQCRDPIGVIPADTGLRFLGSDEVICIRIEHERCLRRCHQARIEADEIEFYAAVFECSPDTGKAHGADILVLLVIAVTTDRAAAVIPENEVIPVCREVLAAILNEARERSRLRHRLGAVVLHEGLETAALELIDLVDGIGNAGGLPA